MTFRAFSALCDQFGFVAVERVPTHWQILLDNEPIVCIWPTTGKFRQTKASPGTGPSLGSPREAIALAEGIRKSRQTAVNGHATAAQVPNDAPSLEIRILRDGGHFDVHVANRTADGLGFEEMLGMIAQVCMPQSRPMLRNLTTEAEREVMECRAALRTAESRLERERTGEELPI